MSSSTADAQAATARHVIVDNESLAVDLDDGRTLSVPLGWYPRLGNGSAEERAHWRFIGKGEGIHWPDLDEDINVQDLLAGKHSGESQESLAAWLEERSANAKNSS